MPATPPRLLIAAGLVTWAIMAGGFVQAGGLGQPGVVTAGVAWAVFPIAFFVAAGPHRAPIGVRLLALFVQTCSVVALTALGWGALAGVLFAVIAGQLPLILQSTVSALMWCLAQTLAFAVAAGLRTSADEAVFISLGFAGFQLFAFGAAHLVKSESNARAEVARVNAELRATQALLAETTRGAERLRISRELHDTMGHHLTALSLQLEDREEHRAGQRGDRAEPADLADHAHRGPGGRGRAPSRGTARSPARAAGAD